MGFWAIFGFCGIMWGALILVFLIGGVDLKHKIVPSILCLVLWVIMAGGLFITSVHNQEVWNEGYCECGTHWELKGVTKVKNGGTTKYYACPNCFEEIEIKS